MPPTTVLIGGVSFITNHTQAVPSTLSNRKIKATSAGEDTGESSVERGKKTSTYHLFVSPQKSLYIYNPL